MIHKLLCLIYIDSFQVFVLFDNTRNSDILNGHFFGALPKHLKREMIFVAESCDDNNCKRFTFERPH